MLRLFLSPDKTRNSSFPEIDLLLPRYSCNQTRRRRMIHTLPTAGLENIEHCGTGSRPSNSDVRGDTLQKSGVALAPPASARAAAGIDGQVIRGPGLRGFGRVGFGISARRGLDRDRADRRHEFVGNVMNILSDRPWLPCRAAREPPAAVSCRKASLRQSGEVGTCAAN
jgi:hypothetical protein